MLGILHLSLPVMNLFEHVNFSWKLQLFHFTVCCVASHIKYDMINLKCLLNETSFINISVALLIFQCQITSIYCIDTTFRCVCVNVLNITQSPNGILMQ